VLSLTFFAQIKTGVALENIRRANKNDSDASNPEK
jgi:hypothetical protein